MIRNSLKMIGITIIAIALLLFAVGFVFVKTSPQFGGKHDASRIEIYQKSGHYESGAFVNEIPTSMDMGFYQFVKVFRKWIVGVPNQAPKNLIPVQKIDSLAIANRPDSITQLTWFGHSAFLLEIEGKNILIDPMFGPTPSPHPWLGRKRFTEGLPIEIENLPAIDAVIFSHDHYDHLDYGSIMKLKDKVKKFYTPLGVGAHLIEWGVKEENVIELNWWEETRYEDLVFRCTPARHFSGRGLGDRFSTLWSSWIIQSDSKNIYFSGDSGYGPHFKRIGEKYGPFDFAMMECGQYNENWAAIHMMPEETAQAAKDLNAKIMMPIHWASFVLSLHSWTDPVERVTAKAKELGVPVSTPKIGEPIILESTEKPTSEWWKEIR